ncbi:MAG: RpiB/LacA/LacB family sugar-phosphate isomerase [Planctomycetota bacterium]|nr:RpiB/LacA/LacB family sugar-phosphate isomerase [Planctomycetota bacterium]
MKIAVGSDHRGFQTKERLKNQLVNQGHDVSDCGAESEASSDYPDFTLPVCNDANVLCLPADLLSEELIRRMVDVWLTTPFEGGRHARRIAKVMAAERYLCGPQGQDAPKKSKKAKT